MKEETFKGKTEELFDPQKTELIYISYALENDIENLKQIESKKYDIKSFDYDGIKYTHKEAKGLITRLDGELKEHISRIEENDRNICKRFYSIAKKEGKETELINKYQLFHSTEEQYNHKTEQLQKLIQKTEFIQYETSVEHIEKYIAELNETEQDFKVNLKEIMGNKEYEPFLTEKMRKNWEEYISKEHTYFFKVALKYDDEALTLLFNTINEYSEVLGLLLFFRKKEVLNFQIELIK